MRPNGIIVAIDGPAGAGKSTTAKAAAAKAAVAKAQADAVAQAQVETALPQAREERELQGRFRSFVVHSRAC